MKNMKMQSDLSVELVH